MLAVLAGAPPQGGRGPRYPKGQAPKGAPRGMCRHLGARTRKVLELLRAREGRRAGAACVFREFFAEAE
jgi:hypothetical protein